ncbi:MAG: hypothetical protein RBT19_11330 [Tenuifilaceae bacterium]|jgi:hypothetical protein|uniref:hypothetical protein n=1 Tax=Perlabentimonas gracilis TaxID=2715279 RepID=UPI001408537E|nr:hypothetical protein [Perlabentimonas gracilis]MDX9770947.1 hypothetical protein [Tenuifilaceae bacterium]NHB69572.1 hypothetical protein [Perlabentimonas gracilis]
MKPFIITITALLFSMASYSQCDEYYNRISCRPSPQEAKDMILSSQSKSSYLEARKTYKFQMTLFGNMDYRIIFCTERKFYPIHYVITEKDTGIPLYDNEMDDYVESIGVSIENTTIVIVEVTLLAKDAKFRDFRQNRACLGVPILYRRIPKSGFAGEL